MHPQALSGVPHNASEPTELYAAMSPPATKVKVTVDEGEGPEDTAFYVSAAKKGLSFPLQCTRSMGDGAFKAEAAEAGAASGAGRRAAGSGGPSKRKKLSIGTALPNEKEDDLDDTAFLVLCSDGVSDFLSDGEIVAAVAQHVAAGGERSDAAHAVQTRALARAAFKNPPLSVAEMAALPAGPKRREVLDDMTTLVVFLR